MGFFSWNCKGCHKSIKAPYDPDPACHNDAVLIESCGSVIAGSYDGYGRIETQGGNQFEINWEAVEPCLWHKKCWEAAGKPPYNGPSDRAADQGYFY